MATRRTTRSLKYPFFGLLIGTLLFFLVTLVIFKPDSDAHTQLPITQSKDNLMKLPSSTRQYFVTDLLSTTYGRVGFFNCAKALFNFMIAGVSLKRTLVLPHFPDSHGDYPKYMPFELFFDVDFLRNEVDVVLPYEIEEMSSSQIDLYLVSDEDRRMKMGSNVSDIFPSLSAQKVNWERVHFIQDRWVNRLSSFTRKYGRKTSQIIGIANFFNSFRCLSENKYSLVMRNLRFSKTVRNIADEFILSNLSPRYLAVHLRRTDFLIKCTKEHWDGMRITNLNCWPPTAYVIYKSRELMKKHQLTSIYILTDLTPSMKEYKILKYYLDFQQYGDVNIVETLHACVETQIAINATVFLGNWLSSMSRFIVEEREYVMSHDPGTTNYFGLTVTGRIRPYQSIFCGDRLRSWPTSAYEEFDNDKFHVNKDEFSGDEFQLDIDPRNPLTKNLKGKNIREMIEIR